MASGEGQVLVSIEDPASSQGQLNSLGWDGMGVGLGGGTCSKAENVGKCPGIALPPDQVLLLLRLTDSVFLTG